MLLSWGTSLPRPARPDAGRREAPAEIGLPPSTFSEGPLPFSSEAGDLSKLEKASTQPREGSDPDNGSHHDDSGVRPRLTLCSPLRPQNSASTTSSLLSLRRCRKSRINP